MVTRLIVVSGGLASGKSALANRLGQGFGCKVIRTSELIRRVRPTVGSDRLSMQRAGNALDRQTRQTWIADEVAKEIRQRGSADPPIILEGVRKPAQMEAIQNAIGHRHVRHIHLLVDEGSQKKRYEKARREKDAHLPFERAIDDASEKQLGQLKRRADVVIDTNRYTQEDVYSHVSARLNLTSRSSERLVDVVIGGQYGSEGKGNIADYLSPEYQVLVRVGGPNAGHKVYEEPPYTHISLPCGTRRSEEADLVIGPGAVLDPDTLLREITECQVEPSRLSIDEGAVLITQDDKDWEAEQLKDEIGSTAMGVGRATARRVTDRFRDERGCKLAKDIASVRPELAPYVRPALERLELAYSRGEKILLEGTQGTGLSIFHGEYPSVTSRDTSVSGCLSEAGIGPRRVNRIVLVCRTYPIRVAGNSGDLSREISWKVVAERSGISEAELRGHEVGSRSGNERRVGEFDWAMLRKSCHLNSPTDIALTFVDYLDVANRKVFRFEELSRETINFVEEVELVSGVPCSLIANRFDYKCVIDRRRW